MLSHVGLPKAEDTESSRRYLFGSTVIVDSISASRIEEACSLITTYFSDFIEVDKLPVAPSPLLQEYMLCQPAMDDGVTITTYCERVSTVVFPFAPHVPVVSHSPQNIPTHDYPAQSSFAASHHSCPRPLRRRHQRKRNIETARTIASA